MAIDMFKLHELYPTSWGTGRYKKVTDPDTGQKVYTGNGVAVHPTKKKRYKINGDNNMIGVEIVRPKALIPELERGRQVVMAAEHLIPGYQTGTPSLSWQEERDAREDGTYVARWIGVQARKRIRKERNAKIVAEYRAERLAILDRTDTPDDGYRAFRKLATALDKEHRDEMTPAAFYKRFATELAGFLSEAVMQTGATTSGVLAVVREVAPKLADAIEGPPEARPASASKATAEVDPETQLKRAIARRDKANREIEKLELELGHAGACKSCTVTTKDFTSEANGVWVCKSCQENNVAVGLTADGRALLDRPIVDGETISPVVEIAPARSARAERRAKKKAAQRAKRQRGRSQAA